MVVYGQRSFSQGPAAVFDWLLLDALVGLIP